MSQSTKALNIYKRITTLKIMGGVDNIFNYKDIQFLPGNPGRAGYIDVQFNF